MKGWTADANGLRFRVEQWPEGFYLFVFRGDETAPFRDELQDSLDLVKAGAAEDYQVPLDSWREEEWPRSVR